MKKLGSVSPVVKQINGKRQKYMDLTYNMTYLKHNLPKYPQGKLSQTYFCTKKCLKCQKSYLTTYMD